MICRLEWDLLAGLMYRHIPILTPAPLIRHGRGGAGGEVAGDVAEAAASAGDVLDHIGTRGGRTID